MVFESNNFRMTYGSYIAYIHNYRYAKSMAMRILTYGFLALMTGFGLFIFWTGKNHGAISFVASLLPPLFCYTVWLISFQYLLPIWALWSARQRGSYRHDCKIYIDKDHVWTIDPTAELKKPWSSIGSILETTSDIFIYFNKCSAFIIPKSAFSSVLDADNFSQSAKDFLLASKVPQACVVPQPFERLPRPKKLP